MTEADLVIDSLGAQGDGIANGPDGRVFVPFGAPGDHVHVRLEGERATILAITQSGAARVPAFCRHFGTCGGCATQHVALETAAEWKRGIIATALRHRGLDPSVVAPTVVVAPNGRRRVTFQARREGGRLRFGYAERGSHRLVDLVECPILVPELAALIAPLRKLAEAVVAPRSEARFVVAQTESGIDLGIEAKGTLGLALREQLAGLAERMDLARISWSGDLVAARRDPWVTFGKARVIVPPGAFLQPSREGEETLARLVTAALEGSTRLADLFAGCGTFALRLATMAQVAAYENDAAMLAALLAGGRTTPGIKHVSAEQRDLFRRPLEVEDLKSFDGAVFDPPRAGAASQVAVLARAPSLKRLAAVSCNPATFARDARTLVDGGWDLIEVVPVDQFGFTPHIELVARFVRAY